MQGLEAQPAQLVIAQASNGVQSEDESISCDTASTTCVEAIHLNNTSRLSKMYNVSTLPRPPNHHHQVLNQATRVLTPNLMVRRPSKRQMEEQQPSTSYPVVSKHPPNPNNKPTSAANPVLKPNLQRRHQHPPLPAPATLTPLNNLASTPN